MNLKISMEFPNKEGDNYLDGKIHEITPIFLSKMDIPDKEMYILHYSDIAYSKFKPKATILYKNNNTFYKLPLDSYKNIPKLIQHSKPANLSILPKNIQLGPDVTTEFLLSLVNKKNKDIEEQEYNMELVKPKEKNNHLNGPSGPSGPNRPNGSSGPNGPYTPHKNTKFTPTGTPPHLDILNSTPPSSKPQQKTITKPAIGIIKKQENNELYIHYFTYAEETNEALNFLNEPPGIFKYFRNLNKIIEKKITPSTNILESPIIINDGEIKHVYNITYILTNYEIQHEISKHTNNKQTLITNCLADRYYYQNKLYHNNFTSKYIGFNNYISHKDTENLSRENRFYENSEKIINEQSTYKRRH